MSHSHEGFCPHPAHCTHLLALQNSDRSFGGVVHRALENSDVIYLVLEHCGRLPDWPWYDSDDYADSDAADDLVGSHIRLHAPGRKSWRTLARCSRVCRAFSRPALRLLWRELPSLFPLCFVCLPMIRVDVERAEWEPVGQRIWVCTALTLKSGYGCHIDVISRPLTRALQSMGSNVTTIMQLLCEASPFRLTMKTAQILKRTLILCSSSIFP